MELCGSRMCRSHPQRLVEGVDSLELKRWAVVSSPVDARNPLWVLCNSRKCSLPLSHLSSSLKSNLRKRA